jgi:hypothetical protein
MRNSSRNCASAAEATARPGIAQARPKLPRDCGYPDRLLRGRYWYAHRLQLHANAYISGRRTGFQYLRATRSKPPTSTPTGKTAHQGRSGPPSVARYQEPLGRGSQAEGHLDLAERNWTTNRLCSPITLRWRTAAAGPSCAGAVCNPDRDSNHGGLPRQLDAGALVQFGVERREE